MRKTIAPSSDNGGGNSGSSTYHQWMKAEDYEGGGEGGEGRCAPEGGAGIEESAPWRGRLRAAATRGIIWHTRYGGRACIDGRWDCCPALRWP
jgi:hypothetical protein